MNDRKRSAFFRGSDGMRRTDEELERAKQKAEQRKNMTNQPFRFRVPVGETRRIIICDDMPDFFLYEHALKDSDGNWGKLFTGCVKSFDNCPICEAQGKESYYAMYLTCIDLTPFKLRDGTEVEFSRKLLVVKPAQQKKFLRFYNKEGTLRGAAFDMTRDGEKDSSIGNDIEFVEFVDEEELATYSRSWKDKDGKKHTENCDEPYEYENLVGEVTTEKLRAIVGGAPAPGSRAQEERELGGRGGRAGRGGRGSRDEEDAPRGRRMAKESDDDWEDADDDLPFDPDEKPARGRTAKRDEEEEEEKPTRRGRPTKAAQEEEEEEPAPRRGRATRKTEEPEEEHEEEESPRASRRRPGRTVKDEVEDEPEEQEEAEPRRGRLARRSR